MKKKKKYGVSGINLFHNTQVQEMSISVFFPKSKFIMSCPLPRGQEIQLRAYLVAVSVCVCVCGGGHPLSRTIIWGLPEVGEILHGIEISVRWGSCCNAHCPRPGCPRMVALLSLGQATFGDWTKLSRFGSKPTVVAGSGCRNKLQQTRWLNR